MKMSSRIGWALHPVTGVLTRGGRLRDRRDTAGRQASGHGGRTGALLPPARDCQHAQKLGQSEEGMAPHEAIKGSVALPTP